MSKRFLLMGFVMMVVVFAGCKKEAVEKSTTPTSNAGEAESVMENESMKFQGELKDLITQGKPLQCRFETEAEAGSTKGTVYVDGERMRATVANTLADGTTSQMQMLKLDEYAYMWGDQYPSGMKIKFNPEEMSDQFPTPVADEASQFDYNGSYEYDCDKWNVDESMLEIPSDVQFMDMSAQMEQMMEAMPSVGADACGACGQLSGAAKSACEQALGCN